MIEVLVWLLVSVSYGSSNLGNAVVLERFKSKEQCEHVMQNLPLSNLQKTACIQANIYIKD